MNSRFIQVSPSKLHSTDNVCENVENLKSAQTVDIVGKQYSAGTTSSNLVEDNIKEDSAETLYRILRHSVRFGITLEAPELGFTEH